MVVDLSKLLTGLVQLTLVLDDEVPQSSTHQGDRFLVLWNKTSYVGFLNNLQLDSGNNIILNELGNCFVTL